MRQTRLFIVAAVLSLVATIVFSWQSHCGGQGEAGCCRNHNVLANHLDGFKVEVGVEWVGRLQRFDELV